jgi:hypothetical protein
MPENIDDLKKLELLNEARNLLNAEYNKKKSDDYNNWLLKNSNAIKSSNFHLPFPPFVVGNNVPFYVATVPLPTEHEVVAKAVGIYNSRYNTTAAASAQVPVVEEAVAPAEDIVPNEEIDIVAANIVEIIEPEIIELEVIEPEIIEPEVMTAEVIEPEVIQAEALSISDELAGLQLRDAMIREIYNIYGDKEIKNYDPPVETKIVDKKSFSLTEDLNVIPQPAEELSKLKTSNNSFASIYQKFQSMKDTLIKPTNKGSI